MKELSHNQSLKLGAIHSRLSLDQFWHEAPACHVGSKNVYDALLPGLTRQTRTVASGELPPLHSLRRDKSDSAASCRGQENSIQIFGGPVLDENVPVKKCMVAPRGTKEIDASHLTLKKGWMAEEVPYVLVFTWRSCHCLSMAQGSHSLQVVPDPFSSLRCAVLTGLETSCDVKSCEPAYRAGNMQPFHQLRNAAT